MRKYLLSWMGREEGANDGGQSNRLVKRRVVINQNIVILLLPGNFKDVNTPVIGAVNFQIDASF